MCHVKNRRVRIRMRDFDFSRDTFGAKAYQPQPLPDTFFRPQPSGSEWEE
jgi:hypothetical protein